MNVSEAKLAGNAAAALVTRADLAAKWGVSRAAVSKIFHRPGAPEFVKGRIALGDAEAWRTISSRRRPASAAGAPVPAMDADTDINEARRRQEVTKARLLDIEYRQKMGALISRDEVEAIAREDGAAVRATLMAMPSRLAPALADAAAGGPAGIATVLDAEVRKVLESWSRLKSLDMGGAGE